MPPRSLLFRQEKATTYRRGSSASVPVYFTVRRLFVPPDGFYPLRRAVLQFGVFFQIPARRLLTEELQQPETVHLAPREAGDELSSRADADQFVYFLKEVGGQDNLRAAAAHDASNSQCGTKTGTGPRERAQLRGKQPARRARRAKDSSPRRRAVGSRRAAFASPGAGRKRDRRTGSSRSGEHKV